jgi:hypothetical protein
MNEPNARNAPKPCGLIIMLGIALYRRFSRWLGLRLCIIYSKPLRPVLEVHPELPGLTYHLFVKNDEEALIASSRLPELDLPEAFIRQALDKGDACATILFDNHVVSYIWFAFKPTHDCNGVHIGFRGNDLYCYKALTLPAYRGRRLPYLLSILGNRYCIAKGGTHIVAYIDIHNLASNRAMVAQGGTRVGFAGYLKRGRFFSAFRTPGVRQRGIYFFLPRDSQRTDVVEDNSYAPENSTALSNPSQKPAQESARSAL